MNDEKAQATETPDSAASALSAGFGGVPPALTLDTAEAELCRQLFDAVQDLNPAYLVREDYVLAKRLYEALGMRVPHSILEHVTPNVQVTGAARLYRAASSDRRERG